MPPTSTRARSPSRKWPAFLGLAAGEGANGWVQRLQRAVASVLPVLLGEDKPAKSRMGIERQMDGSPAGGWPFRLHGPSAEQLLDVFRTSRPLINANVILEPTIARQFEVGDKLIPSEGLRGRAVPSALLSICSRRPGCILPLRSESSLSPPRDQTPLSSVQILP